MWNHPYISIIFKRMRHNQYYFQKGLGWRQKAEMDRNISQPCRATGQPALAVKKMGTSVF
jgi:hypothetical protein